jgi:DNA (cytosine-5)-methyltransferase 1
MFGLRVIRHRLFEVWPEPIWFPPSPCQHNGKATSARTESGRTRRLGDEFQYLTVIGHAYIVADAKAAMCIDWMTRAGLSQSIPPAYTAWIGRRLLEMLPEATP